MTLKDDVDELVSAVEENTTVDNSVMALLDQLSTMLKNQVTDPATQAKLQAAISALKAQNKQISDAVLANTPQAPTT